MKITPETKKPIDPLLVIRTWAAWKQQAAGFTPETLCNKCGRCCYFKEVGETGELRFSKVPCQFLDLGSKLCRVYPIRHKVAPWCVEPLKNLENDPCLPTDCPLAQVYGPPGYVGPKEKP